MAKSGTSLEGITIELNGDSTGLTTALKNIQEPLNDTQTDLRQVQRLLKMDPGNTELIAQKQRLLGQAVSQTKEKLEVLKTAAEQANEQLQKGEITQDQYDKLQREIIETERSLENLEKAAAQTNTTMMKIAAAADKVASGARKVADATRGMSTAAAGALTGLAGMAYSAVTGADDLNTLAKQTGFTTAELQKMEYAADRVDVAVQDITGAAKKLKANMASSSDSVASAFRELRVSATDANDQMRDTTAVFWEVVEALSRVGNETERDQLAMTLFGKSADSLAGIIDDGGRAFHELGDEAERAGLIMSQETLDSLNAVNDEIDRVKATASAALKEAGAKALEAFLPVLEKILAIIIQLLTWLGSLDAEQMTFLVTILAIVAAISPIASIIATIAGAVSSLIPLLTAAFGFLVANPWLLGIAAIAAAFAMLVYQIASNWDEIKAGAQMVAEEIKAAWEAFGQWYINLWQQIAQMVNNIFQGFLAIGQAIASGLTNIVSNAVNHVMGLLSSLMSWIQSVAAAIASLFGGGGGGYGGGGGGRTPKFANGGELTHGSAIVGDAGPELLTVTGGRAVVTPLPNATAQQGQQPAGQQFLTKVNISFSGSLAQLGAVMQPVIAAETVRLGSSLVR